VARKKSVSSKQESAKAKHRQAAQAALPSSVLAAAPTATSTPSPSTRPRRARCQQTPIIDWPWLLFEELHIPAFPQPRERLVGTNGFLWIIFLSLIPILYVGFALTVSVSNLGLPLDLRPWIDNDYWWHLATGDWMVQHHEVPTTDPFLYTWGKEWVAHEWLGELLITSLDRLAGYQANIMFTWILAIAGFGALIIAARIYGLPYLAALILVLLWFGVYLRPEVIMVRPQMWTFSFFAFLFLGIALHETGRVRRLWGLIPLFLVWTNINLTVTLGLVCLGAYILDRMVRREASRGLIITGILCLGTLLINPAGPHLLEAMFKYRGVNEIWQARIFEWMPPDYSDRVNLGFALAIPMALPAIWQLLKLRVWPGVPLLISLYKSLDAVRFAVIYVLIAFIFAAWLVWRHRQERPAHALVDEVTVVPKYPWLLLPAAAAIAVVLWVASTYDNSQFLEEPVAWGYPERAATLVLENNPGAVIFNTYDFGGYLDHRFMANPKIFIDGRGEIYDRNLLAEYFSIIDGEEGWQERLSKRGVDAIILRPTVDNLGALLPNEPGWQMIYSDDYTALWVTDEKAGN
jgi:hypothetical protein